MPQIIVTADHSDAQGEPAVMLRERVNVSDFESEHFASQLVERLGWAVGDAYEVEHELARLAGQDHRSASVVTTAS
jgi:hypothetical protein